MNKNVLAVVLLVVGLAVGFFGGMQYQKSQAPAGRFGNGNGQFTRRFGNGQNANASIIRGQIISSDANSITVKLPDGSSQIVIVGSSALISKAVSGAKSDLANGQQVMVFGTKNSDGSVTAQNVQLNPMGGFGGQRASGSTNQ